MSTWSKALLRKVAYTAKTGWAPSKAIPAQAVTACCSAMPTSMTRSGNASCMGPSPTGSIIAAVTPTTSSRSRATRRISSAKTAVHPKRWGAIGNPVSGWIRPTAWNRSAMSSSAGVYPRPFSVMTWTMTARWKALARVSAVSRATSSCPSTGPRYLSPRSSNITWGARTSLTPTFNPWRAS